MKFVKKNRLKKLRSLTFAKSNIEKIVKERLLFKNYKQRFERSLHLCHVLCLYLTTSFPALFDSDQFIHYALINPRWCLTMLQKQRLMNWTLTTWYLKRWRGEFECPRWNDSFRLARMRSRITVRKLAQSRKMLTIHGSANHHLNSRPNEILPCLILHGVPLWAGPGDDRGLGSLEVDHTLGRLVIVFKCDSVGRNRSVAVRLTTWEKQFSFISYALLIIKSINTYKLQSIFIELCALYSFKLNWSVLTELICPSMTCYLTSMDNISLSRTVFEIFDFILFRVWPWPLTPESHLGSKMSIPFESPYMTSYLTSMDNISLSRTVFEIFDFKVFKVWPWPLTHKGHLGSKCFKPFESPYMTSHLFSMDTISLSRTVLEIFDIKVFRVWPWPLTPEGHLGSKKIISFGSPYMTSYLTFIDNISPFRTVLEIFNFKVFRVWPWPWTPKIHLGSKNVIPFESPYMTSYLTSMDNISLSFYLVPFSRYSTSKFLGFDLDLRPLKVIWGQNVLYHLKAHIWLPIWLLWTPSLYLVPFSRYSTSKFLWFDLDLWPLKVIWGQIFSHHLKAHVWLSIRLL